MWRLFLATIGFVGENPLYRLGRRKRLAPWQARPVFLGLVPLWYGTLVAWMADRFGYMGDWWFIVIMGQLWLPFIILPVLGAALAAAAAKRDADAGLWQELALTRLRPEQILTARAVGPLRLVSALLLGLGVGWVGRGLVEFVYLHPQWNVEGRQTLGAFAAATLAGLFALVGVVLDALRRGMHRSRAAAVSGAVLASLALQAGIAALVVLGLLVTGQVTTVRRLLDGPPMGWLLFWVADALLNAGAAAVLWRRALHAVRWAGE